MELFGKLHLALVATGQHPGKQVALLVLVVVRAGQVEVAQDVACRLACLIVGPLGGSMLLQALQQRAHAQHALVAGLQHVQRLFEGGGQPGAARFKNGDSSHGVRRLSPKTPIVARVGADRR